MSLEPTERRMTHAEAVMLCRYAKAACPQQQFDEYTPDAWSDLLSDLRFVDCQLALKTVVQRQPFVAPAEVRDEVARIRSRRLSDYGPIPEPEHLDHDSPTFNRDYRDYLAEIRRDVADGTLTRPIEPEPEPDAIGHDVIRELGHIGQTVDHALAAKPSREALERARLAKQAADADRKRAEDERRAEHERMRAEDEAARAARCACGVDRLTCPQHRPAAATEETADV
jgi:hypothetical protein